MNDNFYSNDVMVKIRMDERMAEAEAYRQVTPVEQSNVGEQPTDRAAFDPFSWIRRLVLRIGTARA